MGIGYEIMAESHQYLLVHINADKLFHIHFSLIVSTMHKNKLPRNMKLAGNGRVFVYLFH